MVSLSECAVFKGAEAHFLLQDANFSLPDDQNVMVSPSHLLFLKGLETHFSYMNACSKQEEEEGAERRERIVS